ncbi:MAG: FHA domain-containing protein [Candidatus Abyssobacteria bacterium SURF_5]|uniref:histidine kinase n=1 Tax=Abyssobacteria bacterium (strain SURF_5) TaxID=2093360 RepID=A0A3A4NE63_ABYX5|nr:MAG: FHA domain-containing protein [Candidatus Abyssubacteria bacterium SURF_5]
MDTVIPKLVVVKGLSAQTYCITSDSISLGRALSNDFVISAEGVSRIHARIFKVGSGYHIEDMGSTNGTFIGEQQIKKETELRDGDVIGLGRSVALSFVFPLKPEKEAAQILDLSDEAEPVIRSAIDSGEREPSPRLISTIEIPSDIQFLRRTYQRLALLYQVNNSVGSMTDLDQLFERIAVIVVNLKKADRVAILLQDEQKELVPAVVKEKAEGAVHHPMHVNRAIVQKVIGEGIGILSDDGNDPRGAEGHSGRGVIGSVICGPLKRKEKIIGAIYVACLNQNEEFDEEDLKLLIAVCNEASIVIDNAYSYREIEELNKGLEEKVRQRTADLERALENLKDAQLQLVQSERASAVAQLLSGIAHEINNPVNYIMNGIDSLSRYVRELRWMNESYCQAARQAGLDLSEIEAEADRLNFSEHMSMLSDLLLAIHDGARRTAEIVQSLRGFSRTGESEIKEIDLNQTIDESLRLLSYRLKEGVTVEIEKGDIPLHSCYASQMGQVFLNLLDNAEQAIGQDGRILIKTWCDPSWVFISISDSGKGIAPEIIPKIFDPFFTTKTENGGIGLGLSISMAIVKRHGGDIRVQSEPGSGTTFTISLPREAKPGAAERG